MSTRCQIKLKEEEDGIYIYKHCDGYPEGVMPILKPFVKRFIENRGYDYSYLLCQIVREFSREGDGGDYTGWGLDRVEHMNIEFLYEVDVNGDIYINGKLDSKEWNKE